MHVVFMGWRPNAFVIVFRRVNWAVLRFRVGSVGYMVVKDG